jgi:hypothetical protein
MSVAFRPASGESVAAGRGVEVEAIVIVAFRRVPDEFVAVGRAVEDEAIVIVAFRRVPDEFVAVGRAVEDEAIVIVAFRRVLAESVVRRVLQAEAMLKSGDLAVLDRGFCYPNETNPHVRA